MDPIEAHADAIMFFEGWKPETKSYENRNPGNLRDGQGNYRTFQSLIEGYGTLLSDLRAKYTGHTRTKLTPDSTLAELTTAYAPPSDNNPTAEYMQFVASWMTRALGKTITPNTLLKEIWTP